jgi:hypothetical protein
MDASNALSVSSCRTSRPRVEPIDNRIAISLCPKVDEGLPLRAPRFRQVFGLRECHPRALGRSTQKQQPSLWLFNLTCPGRNSTLSWPSSSYSPIDMVSTDNINSLITLSPCPPALLRSFQTFSTATGQQSREPNGAKPDPLRLI